MLHLHAAMQILIACFHQSFAQIKINVNRSSTIGPDGIINFLHLVFLLLFQRQKSIFKLKFVDIKALQCLYQGEMTR